MMVAVVTQAPKEAFLYCRDMVRLLFLAQSQFETRCVSNYTAVVSRKKRAFSAKR